MFYVQTRLGAQSNVLISAHYTSQTSDGLLARDAVHSAIGAVISAYPELALIGVAAPASKVGKQILQIAALHEIDLDSCIEFRDEEKGVGINYDQVERIHNEWDMTGEKLIAGKPWWKVIVINQRQVIFAFHHLVSDGRFGTIFHREFLAALNSPEILQRPPIRFVKIDPERLRLTKEVERFGLQKTALPLLIAIRMLLIFLARMFFGKGMFFHDLPKPRMYATLSETTDGSPPKHRTTTRISTLRVSQSRTRPIIEACRQRGTTFTPLLIAMVLCELATDRYPDAKLGLLFCALDMRPVYPKNETLFGRIIQCSGGSGHLTWVSEYQKIFRHSSKSLSKIGSYAERDVDVELAWKLIKRYHESLKKQVNPDDPKILKNMRAGNTTAPYLEDTQSTQFPALGFHARNAFQVSNLGIFSTTQEDEGPWKIDDMSFSTATVNGNLSVPLNINVIGIQGGDLVINASYEDGILSEDLVSEILEGVVGKMEALASLS